MLLSIIFNVFDKLSIPNNRKLKYSYLELKAKLRNINEIWISYGGEDANLRFIVFKLHPEDGSDIFLRNVDNHHAASQPTSTYRGKVAMKTYVRGNQPTNQKS
jgi:hypothetical protein